ncbi:trihelix transcription factor GT-1-like isoform X1 [Pecten maximus]|uniref:trihelix transcription factor GT-1-like isoform X1 n=1 Tax=Pecten maximus TaxID=6579 RepID=UPI001458D047|nr:trihelix transcription factor GT-1-like isoform X1 [Pecten maximus]
MASSNFYRCNCGVFFCTLAAAMQHRCTKAVAGDTATCSSASTTSSRNIEDVGDSEDRTMFECDVCKGWFLDMKTFDRHDCIMNTGNASNESPLAAASSSSSSEKGNPISTCTWNRKATLMLIDLYKKLEESVSSGKMKKKVLWEKIAKELQSEGYSFCCDQVSGRWKSLMRAYKNVKDHNKKSGNNPKTYEYEEELDEIFGQNPCIVPKFTLSTNSSKRPLGDDSDDNDDDDDESVSSNEARKANPPKQQRKSSANEIVEVFKSYIADQEKKQKEERGMRERMHKERMSVMTSLIQVLKGKNEDDK